MKIVFFLALVSFCALSSIKIDAQTTLPPLCKFDAFRRSIDCENVGLESFPNVDSRTRKLILAKNNISRINGSLLDSLQELQYLDISQNKLESLDEYTLASLTSLLFLKISGNPFTCDCHLEWLRQELSGLFQKHRFTILDGSGISCLSPENILGKSLSAVNDTLYCDNEKCKTLDSKFSEDSVCDEHAVCTMVDQRYVCQCKSGYNGDGISCSDINECIDTNDHSCHRNASCINIPGSYQCQCMPGYHGDGRSCRVVSKDVASVHYQKLAMDTGKSTDRRAGRFVEITIIAGSFALVTVFVVMIFVCL